MATATGDLRPAPTLMKVPIMIYRDTSFMRGRARSASVRARFFLARRLPELCSWRPLMAFSPPRVQSSRPSSGVYVRTTQGTVAHRGGARGDVGH